MRRLYRLAQSFYFSGTDARDFRKLLALVRPKIEFDATEAMDTAAERFVARNLDEGRLVIVGIEDAARKLNHWVLAIGQAGVERSNKFQARRFLIVDPGDTPDQLVPWNATLETGPTAHARLFRKLCDVRGEPARVRLSGAIALSPRRR